MREQEGQAADDYHRSPFVVIFTDLDGTLLDQDTYGWEEAKPALEACKRRHFPVVLVSSKTRAEIVYLQERLGISAPFIVENGGGVFFSEHHLYGIPPDAEPADHLWKVSLGIPYREVVKAFEEIRAQLGWNMRGFSQMTVEEIAQHTGLDLHASSRAAMREYDEPFLILEKKGNSLQPLKEATEKKGHLHGDFDKGLAVQRVESWYGTYHETIITMGLGDSPNDFSMLQCVDLPVLVRSSSQYQGLEKTIRGLTKTQEPGPKGWNKAVLDILRNKLKGG
ncbi:MAG: HAD-IIB family hydrolase [Deltaproteobacteria bacterium]|nr:HAD-IIB family hydrolase [Deltaproteobacteria bacterium]